MAGPVFPKVEDKDVQAAAKSNGLMRSIVVHARRTDSNHLDGAKACSVYDAEAKKYKIRSSIEICKQGNKITFAPFNKEHLKSKIENK